jgi:hypothetical protein
MLPSDLPEGLWEVTLQEVGKAEPRLRFHMSEHYSAPKGFVGRSICYLVMSGSRWYGSIVAGSSTAFLPGRKQFFNEINRNNIVNNIFFHVEKVDGRYPFGSFTAKVLREFRRRVVKDWEAKYGDKVIGFESLVELPRSGNCYKRDGWKLVGQTKGFTCKRTAGKGTDSWSGKRVWDTKNLRPKLVFMRHAS